MKALVHQGDILKIERIKSPVLVVSKDFFNQTGEVIGCPIFKDGESGALHIFVEADTREPLDFVGFILCSCGNSGNL